MSEQFYKLIIDKWCVCLCLCVCVCVCDVGRVAEIVRFLNCAIEFTVIINKTQIIVLKTHCRTLFPLYVVNVLFLFTDVHDRFVPMRL